MKKAACENLILAAFIIVLLALPGFAQTIPNRVAGSPYPASLQPDTVFETSEGLPATQRLTIMTLQGLLAKAKPKIVRKIDPWISDLQANYGLIVDTTYMNNFKGLITHFKNNITSYVLCNLGDSTASFALSLCGRINAIAVTTHDTALMDTIGITKSLDARTINYSWLFSTYTTLLSKTIVSYQADSGGRDLSVGDYTVFSNAFSFWRPVTNATTTTAFNRMTPGGVVMGYPPSEDSGVSALSKRSLVLHASDWADNLSVYTNYSIAQFQQKAPPAPFALHPNTHTVCFVMTDGDNVQWLVTSSTNQSVLASPDRSKLNLGWTMSPAMCELAPTILKYYYDNAPATTTGRSYYIAGPSGRGYFYPSLFGALDTECTLLNRYMAKAGLNIVNIIDIDSSLDSSSKFTAPYTRQSNIDAVFLYSYQKNYVLYGSTIAWSNNKPVITGRQALWSGDTSMLTSSVAKLINAQSTNISTPGAYSLIPVNVWTMNVDSVIACIGKLGPNVRVVAPDEFVWLIQHALGTGVHEVAPLASARFSCSLRKGVLYLNVPRGLAGAVNAGISLYSPGGALLTTVNAATMRAGVQKVDLLRNMPAPPAGMYLLRIVAGAYRQNEKMFIP